MFFSRWVDMENKTEALSRNFRNAMRGRRTYDGFKADAMRKHGLTGNEYAALAPRAARLAKSRDRSVGASGSASPRRAGFGRALLAAALGGLALSSGVVAPHDPQTIPYPYPRTGRNAVNTYKGEGYRHIRAYREARAEASRPKTSPMSSYYVAPSTTSPAAPPVPERQYSPVNLMHAARNDHEIHLRFLGKARKRSGWFRPKTPLTKLIMGVHDSKRYVTPAVPEYANSHTPLYRGVYLGFSYEDEPTARDVERALRKGSASYTSFSRSKETAEKFGSDVILRITPERIAPGTPLEWFDDDYYESETLLPPGTFTVLGKAKDSSGWLETWDVSFAPARNFAAGASPPPAGWQVAMHASPRLR